ncbi:MAG: cytochrome c biogenesis protein CcdA [Clostridia bacterium]|nr:cytochrome c biogenesis protein CcdA [Clostridia bacterium]
MDTGTLFIWSVFAAGMLSFFSPCIVPLLPVYVGTLSRGLAPDQGRSDAREDLDPVASTASAARVTSATVDFANLPATTPLDRKPRLWQFNRRLFAQTLVFIAGLGTSFILLGFGAGALGTVFNSRLFLVLAGGVVIVLGLHQTGLFKLLFLEQEKRLSVDSAGRGGIFGSYLLGLTFSFGWTPCIGPVLAAVLVMASSGNQALQGGFFMLVYTLGMAVPFLLVAVFTQSLLRLFKRFNRYLPVVQKVGGVLIIAMGVLLMTDRINVINSFLLP